MTNTNKEDNNYITVYIHDRNIIGVALDTWIPQLRSLRQKDYEFKANLDYTIELCLKWGEEGQTDRDQLTEKTGHFFLEHRLPEQT